jgi:hypothetical protein
MLRIIYAMVCCGLVCSTTTASDPTVEKILSDWLERFNKVNTVRYTLSGTTVQPNFKMAKPLDVNLIVTFDLEKRRIRIEESRQVAALRRNADKKKLEKKGTFDATELDLFESYKLYTCDGKKYYHRMPKERNLAFQNAESTFSISTGNLFTLAYATDFWPLFDAHGIVGTTKRILRPDKLPETHKLDDFHIRGQVNHDKRPCTLLGNDPPNEQVPLVDEFYVDVERESAISRRVYYGKKIPVIKIDVVHARTDHGWMPASWTKTSYSPVTGSMIEQVKLKVDRIEFNVSLTDDMFTLTPQPGEIVTELEYPETGRGLDLYEPARRKSLVKSDGSWQMQEEKGFKTAEGVQLQPEKSTWHWWLIGSLGAVVLIAGGYILYRRQSKAKTMS